MPRDGSGVYTKPYPNVVSGTTIESLVYNGQVNDVTQDLNTPRPIVAGGTGANNADQALINLSAEKAKQNVSNYSSHSWVSGSFYSGAGAIDAPLAGSAFAGWCFTHSDSSYTTVHATYLFDTMTPARTWVRERRAGVWGAWSAVINANSFQTPGGTSYNDSSIELGSTTVAGTANIDFHSSGTGSDFDARISVTGGNATAGSGALNFNAAVTNVSGGVGVAGTILAGSSISSSSGALSGIGFGCRQGTSGPVGLNTFNLNWNTTAMQLWVDAVNLGLITVSSDYRIKKDVLDLPGMWDTVKALRPIKYTQAEFTPPSQEEANREQLEKDADYVAPGPAYAADDIERWGFVAHELQETLLPSAANGEKDSHDTVQSPNWAPIVAALTKALQEAMARIEALEAGG